MVVVASSHEAAISAGMQAPVHARLNDLAWAMSSGCAFPLATLLWWPKLQSHAPGE
jgi:hypothetical protein